MGITKKISQGIILILLLVFPLGQLTRLEFYWNDWLVVFHLLDFLLVLVVLVNLKSLAKSRHFKSWFWIGVYLLFSFTVSFLIFGFPNYLRGGFYLLRLLSQLAFFLVLKESALMNRFLQKLWVIVLVVSAFLGWYQFLTIPDLRFLADFGWDDHYYRLAGAFLDPGFAGLIFALAAVYFLQQKKWLGSAFFAVTSLFTYSRASMMALLAGVAFILLRGRQIKRLLVIAVGLLLLIGFLPNRGGEGNNLKRTFSVVSRLANYSEAVQISTKSPLLGIGYNNYCEGKAVFLGATDNTSHSCSGADSSILFLLATTGVIGVLLIGKSLQVFVADTPILWPLLVVLLTHSLFVNSFFYSWVWVVLALATARKKP